MKHCIHASESLSEFIVRCEHFDANQQFGTHAHIENCAICPFRQPEDGVASGVPTRLPDPCAGDSARYTRPRLGLGDLVERIAKPFARAIGADCLDEHGALKPDSDCAKRRDALNKVRPG